MGDHRPIEAPAEGHRLIALRLIPHVGVSNLQGFGENQVWGRARLQAPEVKTDSILVWEDVLANGDFGYLL